MRTIALALVMFVVSAPIAAAQEQGARVDTSAVVSEAGVAVSAWLKLIDEGEYTDSWDTAAASFKAVVTTSQWEQALGQARGPFEPFGKRTLAASQFTTELPNVPGMWVILDYQTETAQGNVVERVSITREEDGVWRAGGYFVVPQ